MEPSPLNARLMAHPIYSAVSSVESLRVFMESHVFAVWDFMSLLKAMQRQLTVVEVPWTPAADPVAARVVNEIVLGEETDEVEPGRFCSHLDLYLEAMEEVGANRRPFERFLRSLAEGDPLEKALRWAPPGAARFVQSSFRFLDRAPHVVTAALVLGREDPIPRMFEQISRTLEDHGLPCPILQLYLQRHQHLDSDRHGPMGRELLDRLCAQDPSRETEARHAAEVAISHRIALWDDLHASITRQGHDSPRRVDIGA